MNPAQHGEFFVGREIELAHLDAAVDSATSRFVQITLLFGERGIGKTSLLNQLAFRTAARGLRVLRGRWERGSTRSVLSFHVFGTKPRQNGSEFELAESIVSLENPGPLKTQIRNWLQNEKGKPASPGETRQLKEASATVQTKSNKPSKAFLLLIDDLESRDRASLLLLRILMKEVRTSSGLIVVACSGDPSTLSADVDAMAGNLGGDVERLELRGLNRTEVGRLVTAVTGEAADSFLVDTVFQASQGSPTMVVYLANLFMAYGGSPPSINNAPIVTELPFTSDLKRSNLGHANSESKECFDSMRWLEREGDYWTIVFRGRTLRLRHLRGLIYIDYLVQHPGKPVHVLDLATLGVRPEDRESLVGDVDIENLVGTYPRHDFQGEIGPILDLPAKKSYARRLSEINEELEEARQFNDLGRISNLEEERSILMHELTRSTGLNGRDRKGISVAERARVSVTHAIKFVLRRIRNEHPELGRSLCVAISTGMYCLFQPELMTEPEWKRRELDRA